MRRSPCQRWSNRGLWFCDRDGFRLDVRGMAEVTLEQRFHGTVALAILHLRRLAKSNDVDAGFAAARELLMIDGEQERFMRECLALDDALKSGDASADDIPADSAGRLQACVLSINSADPA